MRIAVLGAGIAGLVAAHRLTAAGHECDVLERWPGLGGQAATIDVGDGVLVERYYHHLFTSDREMRELCAELGVELEAWPSSVAMFAGGRVRPFTTPLDLLRYDPLPLAARLRMGLAVVDLQLRHRDVAPFEEMTARAWVERRMGRAAYRHVWGPLLSGKFHGWADEVGMSWLWAKLQTRRQVRGEVRGEVLLYPRGSFEAISVALRDRVVRQGGRVLIDRPARSVELRADGGFDVTPAAAGAFRHGHDPCGFPAAGPPERYDAVLATVPTDVFGQLLAPRLAQRLAGYVERAAGVPYLAALCLLLEVDRRLQTPYWTNVVDRDVGFIGLVEHTNLVPPERYRGRRFAYVANYLPRDDALLELDAGALLERYTPGLRRIVPGFDPAWVRQAWAFREPAGQPVVLPGHRTRMAPLATGVPGLVLANTTQVYPEDRGTNYAVRLGDDAARALVSGLAARAPS